MRMPASYEYQKGLLLPTHEVTRIEMIPQLGRLRILLSCSPLTPDADEGCVVVITPDIHEVPTVEAPVPVCQCLHNVARTLLCGKQPTAAYVLFASGTEHLMEIGFITPPDADAPFGYGLAAVVNNLHQILGEPTKNYEPLSKAAAAEEDPFDWTAGQNTFLQILSAGIKQRLNAYLLLTHPDPE